MSRAGGCRRRGCVSGEHQQIMHMRETFVPSNVSSGNDAAQDLCIFLLCSPSWSRLFGFCYVG